MLQKTSIVFTCSRITVREIKKLVLHEDVKWMPMNTSLCVIATVTEREQSMHPVDPLHLQASPSENGSQKDKIISYKINLKKLETGTKIS